jgi:hypothetical protein
MKPIRIKETPWTELSAPLNGRVGNVTGNTTPYGMWNAYKIANRLRYGFRR